MQTFVPLQNSFEDCASVLDYRRLGKQRIEAFQIYKTIIAKEINSDRKIPWANHPAVLMWEHDLPSLLYYYNCIVKEWITRGYKNNMKLFSPSAAKKVFPWWWGGYIHATHRSNLLRKNPDHYSKFNWKEKPNLLYAWPLRGQTQK